MDYKEQKQKTCSYEEFADEVTLKGLIDDHLYGWLIDAKGITKTQRPPVDVLDYDEPSSIAGGS